MKNDIIWIGIVVAILGAALLGGYFVLRGTGNAVPSVETAQGTTASVTQSPAAELPPQPESSSTTVTEPSDVASLASVSTAAAASTTSPAGATPTSVASGPAGLVAIERLIKSAADYDGRTVTVKGEILAQCAAGCEFSVDDGTGVLSVQLAGEALDKVLAKGSVGKRVEVTGTFHSTPRPQVGVEKLGSWRLY